MAGIKRFVLVVVLAACIGGAFLVLRYMRGTEGDAQTPTDRVNAPGAVEPRPPGLEFKMLRLAGSHKGIKQWELHARRVSTNDATKLARVEGLENVSVFRDGGVYLKGSADTGTYDMNTKNVEIKGGISLVNDKGDSFDTSLATWDSATETLNIPAPLQMRLDGRRISADRARVDVRGETVTAEGNVVIIGENETIRGNRLVYHLKDESISLEGYTDIDMDIE